MHSFSWICSCCCYAAAGAAFTPPRVLCFLTRMRHASYAAILYMIIGFFCGETSSKCKFQGFLSHMSHLSHKSHAFAFSNRLARQSAFAGGSCAVAAGQDGTYETIGTDGTGLFVPQVSQVPCVPRPRLQQQASPPKRLCRNHRLLKAGQDGTYETIGTNGTGLYSSRAALIWG